MMLIASLLILAFVRGSFGEEYEPSCFHTEQTKCDIHRDALVSGGYPETGEELLTACQRLQEYGNCFADAMERCDPDDEEVPRIRQIVSYLRSSCVVDNPTFKVISSNLPCVTHVFKLIGNRPCPYIFSEKSLDALKEIADQYKDKKSRELMECLYDEVEVTCQVTAYERNCGKEVREAMDEVLATFRPGREACTAEIHEELEPFFIVYEEMLEQELELQGIFGSK